MPRTPPPATARETTPSAAGAGAWRPPTAATELFDQLASRHGLLHREGHSRQGLPERYLYSHDMAYRYAFGRWWGPPTLNSTIAWVLLNPATGDTEQRKRPTLDRAITWSRQWQGTGILIVNLFAYRDTKPENLSTVADPVGPHSDEVLATVAASVPRVVAAWGGDGALLGRSAQVRKLLGELSCLGTTAKGEARHPLYVKGVTELEPLARPS